VKSSIRDELRKELRERGFSTSLESPHGGLVLSDTYKCAADLADLLDVMVARREKIFRSVDVVGQDTAKRNYDDTVLVIEAAKAVLGRLVLP